MSPRLCLRLSAALTVVFVLGLGGLRALVYQGDGGLQSVRAALFSPGCAPPCFMDIRPYATTVTQAVDLLQRHEWVDWAGETPDISPAWSGLILWTWSGSQPAWIPTATSGTLRLKNGIVELIEVPTLLTYSDLWLMFGQPDEGTLRRRLGIASHPRLLHFAAYHTEGLGLRLETPCPLRPVALWDAPVTILLGSASDVQLEPYDLRGWFLNRLSCPH